MARPNQSAHPIQTLRDAILSLKSSVRFCIAGPDEKSVHKLRTSIRRIEAHLDLLSLLPQLPPHDALARKAHRLLKQLRRAAGRIRDLDVQRTLIQSEISGHEDTTRPDHSTRADARNLRRKLKHKRADEADRLLHLLHRQRQRLPRVLDALLATLAPAESIALTPSQLAALVHQWYRQAAGPDPVPHDAAQLHSIRKRAKLARYMAESAPHSAVGAHRLATRFLALQQSGGEWHDWLILANLTSEAFGPGATLSQSFAARAAHALRDFERRLRTMARR